VAGELAAAASALDLDGAACLRSRGDAREATHDHLFGHTVRGRCPAYEVEYGEPKGHRYAHEISDLQGFYRAFGLRTTRRCAERADHIAVECEFMAFLALKEACAEELAGEEERTVCRDAARRFLKDHLGRFGRAFALRVRRRTKGSFFGAAAGLLDRMILSDSERLGVTAGPVDLPLREDAGTPDDACVECRAPSEVPR
jgi:TorA maturation chaperone TorD